MSWQERRNPEISLLTLIVAFVVAAMTIGVPAAQAQTFSVIHSFTGGSDGSNPASGLTPDSAGNFYGATGLGGHSSEYCGSTCGMVFKFSRGGSGWIYSPLYLFPGQDGGAGGGPLTFGPDGGLYGVGGDDVYSLQPPPTRCSSFLCQWNSSLLYTFCCGSDTPGGMTFDQAGNMYGAAEYGGNIHDCSGGLGCGYIYRMAKVGSGWTFSIIYGFQGGSYGARPFSHLVFDAAGNLYGTTSGLFGGGGYGNVFKLTPTESGYWNETVLYTFTGGSDGKFPMAGVIMDSAGNLYGATSQGGTNNGGTIFELTASSGYTFNLLYSLSASLTYTYGVNNSMVMDSAGNLYGTTAQDGAYNLGNVFKLTRGDGGWGYTSLHDFVGGSDGAYPVGSLSIDGQGTLFGAAEAGGSTGANCDENFSYQCGVLFQIAP